MLSEHPVLGKREMFATAYYLAPHADLHILTQGGNCYRCSYGSCFC